MLGDRRRRAARGRSGPSSRSRRGRRRRRAARARAAGRRPAATGTSPRPASSSTRSAFAVVFSSVWLPATVVTPSSSTSGLASASRSAIASSWPGSQSRRIGVAHSRASIASTSAAVGSDGCAPGRDAASAPAAQARRSASSRGRPSSSETTRQAVNASPAAVPSTASTGGGVGARDLLPVLEQHRALGAERQATSRAARQRLELVAVDDERGRARASIGRAGAAFRQKNARCARGRDTASTGISSWQSTASLDRARRRARPRSRPGATTIWFSPPRRRGSARRRSARPRARARARRPPPRAPASASSANASSPTAPTNRTSAPSRAAATAWFAPFPPGRARTSRR